MSSGVHVPRQRASGKLVEVARNMQQEGVASVLLPLLTSRFCAPVLPWVEAPLGESIVLYAVAEAVTHGLRRSSCAGRGWRGGGGVGGSILEQLSGCRSGGP